MNRYPISKLLVSASLALAIALSASTAGAVAAPPAATPPLTAKLLSNAEYPVDLAPGGKAQLVNGKYENPDAGVAIQRVSPTAYGDLNGDKILDAAVTLTGDGGGSGVFSYLSVVLNNGGQAKPVDTLFLGDRVRVRSIRISKGLITVSYLDRRSSQPMSARPTVPVTRRYKLAGDQLVALTPLTNAQLNNAEYPLEGAKNGVALFVNGKFEDKENRMTALLLAKPRASGDLNGDQSPDSAVILAANGGGSGVFVYVYPVLNQDNATQPVTGALLGDRINVTGLSIKNGEIKVTYLDRKPDEPMAARPTVVNHESYKLEGDHLVVATPETAAAPEATPAAESQAAGTLADVLASDPDYSTMNELVKAAGLVELLKGQGPYTLFVPINDAFARLDQDTLQAMLGGDMQQIKDILLYHIVKGRLGNLGERKQTELETALPGAKVTAVVDEGGIYLDGRAWIQRYGVPASNGEIEELYSVVLPPMPVTRRLALDGRFKTLVKLIKAAGLAEPLDMQLVNFTLFAPTDEAFAKLPSGAVDQLLANQDLLTAVLQYHIVTPTLMLSELMTPTELHPLYNGFTLPITVDGETIRVKDARIIEADILVPGGVAHVIDAVLLPAETFGMAEPTAPVPTDTQTQTLALPGVLTGTVTYLQRIALDPKAIIAVTLSDVSQADAPAVLMAGHDITVDGKNVPIPFVLKYDPAQIDPSHTYAVQARITVDGKLQWINTSAYNVLTRGGPVTGVEIVVQPVK